MGRDYLKCAVLCYNLDRWRFERSIRLCMEFKITWNKSARRNKILPFFNKIKKMYSPFWFLLSFWAVSSFLGVFEVFVVTFIRRSQGWTEPLRTSRAASRFLVFNKINKMYSPFLVSVVLLGCFIVFGGFEVFVVTFIRRSQG